MTGYMFFRRISESLRGMKPVGKQRNDTVDPTLLVSTPPSNPFDSAGDVCIVGF